MKIPVKGKIICIFVTDIINVKDFMKNPQINEQLNFEKVWFLFQNTDKKFQETDKLLTEKFQETDKKFQETDKKFQETDKKIKALSNLFTTQWGKLI